MTPALDVRDLRFRYGDGTEALRGVSFTVAPGESVGLIGPNGAGKSTLLLHLNGLLPESFNGAGCVSVEGSPIARNNLRDIRRRVGLLFQDANDQLFCPTVLEDVAFGPRQLGLGASEVAHRVADSLAKVGLAGFERRVTHHLSSGEKRRACLAGVLACQPSILVLDEPTSSLDPRGRRELKELLRRIPLTKIVATHDLEIVVELCSRVIVLDKGTIAAEGPTAELLSNEELMLRHDLERPHILRHPHPH
jgi:cobalt transport protein ATP-binding subunit